MAQKKPENAAKGNNKTLYLIGGIVVLAGAAWMVAGGSSGVGSTAALPTPAEFEGIAATVQPDKSSGIVLGDPNAPIEIMEFADYSCPHCAQFSSFAGKLLRQNYVETAGGPVKWVAFDFVLGGFPNTLPAAIAAHCSGEQNAYWQFHDMLFARQTRWYTAANPSGVFREIGEDIGLDMGAWGACMEEGRYIDQIAAARKYGESLGVGSTPTLFINGQLIDLTNVEPYAHIEQLIQAELAASAGATATAAEGAASGSE